MLLSICDLRSTPEELGLRADLTALGLTLERVDPGGWWRAGLVLVDGADAELAGRVKARAAGLGPVFAAWGPDCSAWFGWAQYVQGASGPSGMVQAIVRDAPMLCAREVSRSTLRRELAHDLRTPLGIVAGLTELLQEGLLGPVTQKQWNALSNIDGQTARLLDSLEGLARDVAEPA